MFDWIKKRQEMRRQLHRNKLMLAYRLALTIESDVKRQKAFVQIAEAEKQIEGRK